MTIELYMLCIWQTGDQKQEAQNEVARAGQVNTPNKDNMNNNTFDLFQQVQLFNIGTGQSPSHRQQ